MIPVKIGSVGTTSKSLRQHLNNVTGQREIKELQTTAILGTAQHSAVSADAKVQMYFVGELTLHVAQTVNNITCDTDCK